jgi:hypothetical protein
MKKIKMFQELNNKRRGSSIIFFIAVLLPFTLLGVAMASDYSSIVLNAREAATVADAAVMAAASAIEEGGLAFKPLCGKTSSCDGPDVRANEFLIAAIKRGMVPKTLFPDTPNECQIKKLNAKGKTVGITTELNSDGTKLTVTLVYVTPLQGILGALSGTEQCTTGVVHRSAAICVPQASGAGCVYPGNEPS